jgi:hypothetical protein
MVALPGEGNMSGFLSRSAPWLALFAALAVALLSSI